MKEFQRRYRDGMIQQAGLCIFICGLKDDSGKGPTAPVIAAGVMEEFESAERFQRVLVPIGATGGAAKEIWNQVSEQLDKFCPYISRKDFSLLNDANQKPEAIAHIVGRVITAADKRRPIRSKKN